MPGTPTPKYAIPTLAGSTLARDIDTETNAALTAIDSKFPGYSQGPLASRPVSTGGSPGIAGRFYGVTDQPGRVDRDNGTGWDTLLTAAKTLAPYRLLHSATSWWFDFSTGTLYFAGPNTSLDVPTFAGANAGMFVFDPAHHAVTGLTTKIRLRAWVTGNDILANATFTVGIRPVTSFTGGSGATLISVGAAIASVTLNPDLGDSFGVSADINAPTSGFYVFAVTLSATPSSGARGLIGAAADLHHV